MAVGPFLHILEGNLLRAVDPTTPPSKTRYPAQSMLMPCRACGGPLAAGRDSGTMGQEPGCQWLQENAHQGPQAGHNTFTFFMLWLSLYFLV